MSPRTKLNLYALFVPCVFLRDIHGGAKNISAHIGPAKSPFSREPILYFDDALICQAANPSQPCTFAVIQPGPFPCFCTHSAHLVCAPYMTCLVHLVPLIHIIKKTKG